MTNTARGLALIAALVAAMLVGGVLGEHKARGELIDANMTPAETVSNDSVGSSKSSYDYCAPKDQVERLFHDYHLNRFETRVIDGVTYERWEGRGRSAMLVEQGDDLCIAHFGDD